MIQEIITYLIISAVVLLALLKIIKSLKKKQVKEKCTDHEVLNSNGCGGCGVDCPVRQSDYRG